MLEILYQDSLKGRVKEENQDAYLVKSFESGDMLLAVADGMGGGVMGAELAKRSMELLDALFDEETDYPLQKLKQAIFMVNDELSVMLDGQKGGTTLCMVYYRQGEIFYINIGDSRVWLCRDISESELESETLVPNSARLKPSVPSLINLTVDQNIYEFKRLNNIYTDDEDKRLIHRILGISSNFEIEEILKNNEWSAFGSFELQSGDVLILSSDGFHDYIGEAKAIGSKQFEDVFAYVEEHSNDNITAIIAKEVR